MSGFSRLSGFREHSDLWQCFLPLGAKWMVKIRLRVIKKIPDVGSMWSSPQTRCHVYVAPLGCTTCGARGELWRSGLRSDSTSLCGSCWASLLLVSWGTGSLNVKGPGKPTQLLKKTTKPLKVWGWLVHTHDECVF